MKPTSQPPSSSNSRRYPPPAGSQNNAALQVANQPPPTTLSSFRGFASELPAAAPWEILLSWIQDARQAGIKNPHAMGLATALDHQPSLRMVLFKGLVELPPKPRTTHPQQGLSFFTHTTSRKGQELAAHPQVAALFFWHELDRQVRVEGVTERLSEAASDHYWHSRPRESQIGALVSRQSEPVASKQDLLEWMAAARARYAGQATIPRPESWGGYVLIPERFEFWLDGEFRCHDRWVYQWAEEAQAWCPSRLAP